MTSEGVLSSEAHLLHLVEQVRQKPGRRLELLPLLEESHPIYRDRDPAQISFLRGWILLSFVQVGLPAEALPFVLEELESGTDPYLVGAAAHVLRACPAPQATMADFLLRAVPHIRGCDDALSFEHYRAVVRRPGTGTCAMREIAISLGWLGAHAAHALPQIRALLQLPQSAVVAAALRQSIGQIEAQAVPPPTPSACCCAGPAARAEPPRPAGPRPVVDALELEDQDGQRLRFAEFFGGRPSVVAFFYTRCDNPQKCPLTVSKLARVQKLLLEAGLAEQVRTAAVSYDPGFDLPKRLRSYGQVYGLRMDMDHKLLRTVGGFGLLREFFGLEVGYVGNIVNRHRIEVYLLDRQGQVADQLTRLQWQAADVVERVRGLL